MIATLLDLSTAHIETPNRIGDTMVPDFGSCRTACHEYGWIVFACPSGAPDREFYPEEECPRWLIPIMQKAIDEGCLLINFDQDAPISKEFQTYDW